MAALLVDYLGAAPRGVKEDARPLGAQYFDVPLLGGAAPHAHRAPSIHVVVRMQEDTVRAGERTCEMKKQKRKTKTRSKTIGS